MSFANHLRALWILICTLLMVESSSRVLRAQALPTVQQAQFRSQWVGEQVDQIPAGTAGAPLNGLSSIVGSLQTRDQVERNTEASLANLAPGFPISFKPSLGVGWEFSNQGSTGSNGAVSPGNSPFLAPALALLYDRDHGPWTVSAGYSAGTKYYSNPDYSLGGTSSQRNPISQTALLNLALQKSRCSLGASFTASTGTGYDFSSGSNNRQVNAAASASVHYILTSYTTVDSSAGLNFQNASDSSATPNNNVSSSFVTLSPVYELSDKTHLSAVLGAGNSAQSIQQGTVSPGSAATTNAVSSSQTYSQVLAKVKYDITGKISWDVSLGERLIGSSLGGDANSAYTGLKPAWTFGMSYTPTPKTSFTVSVGEQGTDVVPEFNFALNWNPRQKTHFSLALSQVQSYATTLSSQYQVSTGVIGNLSQQLFSSVDMNLNLGYTQQRFINLANTQSQQLTGQSSGQLPSNMFLGQMTLNWRIRDHISLSNTFSYNTGQNNGGGGSSQGQMWYSISLNFSL